MFSECLVLSDKLYKIYEGKSETSWKLTVNEYRIFNNCLDWAVHKIFSCYHHKKLIQQTKAVMMWRE